MSAHRPAPKTTREVRNAEPDSLLATHNSRLVIGYGNPLRSDDGVGWQVARQLAADLAHDIDVITLHQLTPELAEPISRAGLVVFVDASVGGEPGRIECQAVKPATEGPATFSHDVDPSALLELARLVYGACPTAAVVAVAGTDFGYGSELSREVQVAIPEAVRFVKSLLTAGVSGLDQTVARGSTVRREGGSHA